jgi:hypothetical protein
MPPAGLNVVKRSGKYVYLNAHWKKTQLSCPGSRDFNGLYEFCWPSLYIAIRIMEDIGLCNGDNINSYRWLN